MFMNKILINILLPLFLFSFQIFVALHVFSFEIYADEISDTMQEDISYQSDIYFLLPKEIIDSYFPLSERYLIPDDVRISGLLQSAKTFEQNKNFRQASQYYFFAYRKVQDSKMAPYIRFKQCYLLESLDTSIKCLKEITEKYPSFPLIDAVLFELAKRFYLKQDYDSCISYLEKIEENETTGAWVFTPYVYTFLGIVSYAVNSYEEAMDYHLSAIEALSEYKEFIIKNYLEISRSLVSLKRYDQAEEVLKRIIGSSNSSIVNQEAYILLASSYHQTGNNDLAYSAYSKLLEEFPLSIYRLKAEKSMEEMAVDKERLKHVQVAGIFDKAILTGSYRIGVQEEDDLKKLYSIQMGSFSQEKNANDFIDVLTREGFSAFLLEKALDEGTVYRVRIGNFATHEETEEVKKKLEGLGYSGFIVREN